MEDKYIGLGLAVSSSLAIGMSFIITKKGLNSSATKHGSASDDRSYLANPTWWAGMSLLIIGEAANFAAYTFAPPILVTPLGALSVLIGAVLASFLLNEELGHLGRIGCTLCLVGSLIIVLEAPEDHEVQTVDEILHYALQPGFMFYCFVVLVFTLVMIFAVSPKYGRKSPVVYISICSLVGSISVMSIKGFGVAVKLTLAGNNQFTHPSTYVFGIVVVFCIMVQMNYFNKALDLFSTNVVNPMYYVMFSTATILASLILFQGFYNTDVATSVVLLAGFVVIFLGVHILNISRKPDTPPNTLANGDRHHLPLENGFANPRMSISGRLSMDSSWSGGGPGNGHIHDGPLSAGHGGRTHRSGGIFGSLGGRRDSEDAVGLSRLREEREAEELFDAEGVDDDERTGLTSGARLNDLEAGSQSRRPSAPPSRTP